jgi:hypothetical protein
LIYKSLFNFKAKVRVKGMIKSLLIGGIAICMIGKLFLHAYLDKRHNRFQGIGPATMQHPIYFLPYNMEVKPQYEKLKLVCNAVYYSISIFIILLLIWSYFTGSKLNGKD